MGRSGSIFRVKAITPGIVSLQAPQSPPISPIKVPVDMPSEVWSMHFFSKFPQRQNQYSSLIERTKLNPPKSSVPTVQKI